MNEETVDLKCQTKWHTSIKWLLIEVGKQISMMEMNVTAVERINCQRMDQIFFNALFNLNSFTFILKPVGRWFDEYLCTDSLLWFILSQLPINSW